MVIKKKLKNFLSIFGTSSSVVLLLMLVLGLQMIFCPISYASQPTLEEMTNFIDLLKVKQASGELYSGVRVTGNSTSIATQFLQNTSTIDFSLENVIYAPCERVYGQSTNLYTSQGVFLIANNGFGNDNLDFLYTYKLSGNQPYVYLKNQNLTYYPKVYNINGSSIQILNNCNYLYVPSSAFTWTYNTELTVFSNSFFFTKLKTASIYVQVSNTYYPMLNNYSGIDYNTYYYVPEPEPEEPSGDSSSTGVITNPSGEITGNINLTGIENSLNNIENKIPTSGEISTIISGEINKVTETLTNVPDISNTQISSGEIINSLGFNLATDRYSNFWFVLTNNLKSALLGVNRSIQISFRGNTWTISLDNFAILPAWLIIIITPFSTCFFVWILAKWWKLIIDKLTSGNVDSLLKDNSEEGISNML